MIYLDFMDSRGGKFGNLWRAEKMESCSPYSDRKSHGPGSLDPGFLEGWRLGDLEAWLARELGLEVER